MDGTHSVCGHHYVLVFSGYGVGIGPYAFDLGALGKLTPVRWERTEGDEVFVGTLVVEAINYPEHVFAAMPGTPRVHRRYRLGLNALKGTVAVKETL